jgi:hypothetical protein
MINKERITLLTIMLFFQSVCLGMDLKAKSEVFIGIFPNTVWEQIAISMFPLSIEKSQTIIELSKQVLLCASLNKLLNGIFTQELLKAKILKLCKFNLSLYGAKHKLDQKAKKKSYENSWLVVGALLNAVNDSEDFNRAIYNPERTEEQIEYIRKCIATWNVEMEICYYPENSNKKSLHLGGTFLNQISRLNDPIILKELIDRGVDCTKKNPWKHTPVRAAMKYGYFKSAQLLLNYVHDYKNLFDCNSLFFREGDAHFGSFFLIIKELIESNKLPIDALIVNFKQRYEMFSCEGSVPLLFTAILHDNTKLKDYLIDKGADPDAKYDILYHLNGSYIVTIQQKRAIGSFAQKCRQLNARKLKK